MKSVTQNVREFLDYYNNPHLVWSFQEYFGVRKVRIVENSPGKKFEVQYAGEAKQKDNFTKLRHKRHPESSSTDSINVNSSGYSSAGEVDDQNVIYYDILSWFWYYAFLFGTQLGDETYYAIFFSFWFWNIDGAVGRRVVLVWNMVMYIGQGMKDIVRWPRPQMPVVVQLEKKWALEYGMPSTHAMIGLAVPFSVLIFTWGRYQYPFYLWASIALVWCSLVCTSRLYLGMHSLADIYVGLAFSAFLLVFVLPLVDGFDFWLLSSPWAPLVTILASVAAVIFYPGSDRWTPARGDTTVILGTYLGVQLGVWTTFQTGLLQASTGDRPYPILWPTYEQYGQTLLRMAVGGVILIATRAIVKPLSYFSTCLFLGVDMKWLQQQKNDIRNKHKIIAELSYKFLTYIAIGFNTTYTTPIVFRAIGCERPTYFTEV